MARTNHRQHAHVVLIVIMLLLIASLGQQGMQQRQQNDVSLSRERNAISLHANHDSDVNVIPSLHDVPNMKEIKDSFHSHSVLMRNHYDESRMMENDSPTTSTHAPKFDHVFQNSGYLFNASLDRTIYGSGSTIHVSGFLGFSNGTPIQGNEINITLYDNFDQKISSITSNSLIDGTWSADYQLSVTLPSGGYYLNASTQVNNTSLSLQLNFVVVSQSTITFDSLEPYPNPPVLGFPTSIVVKLSSSDVETVKVIYTLDNGTTWNQTSLLNSLDDPTTFTAIIGTFYTKTTIQWFVMVIDSDGKIKESSLQNMTFQQFQASLAISIPSNPLTHVTHLINVDITTNIPEDYYYLKIKAKKSTTMSTTLATWKIGPHQYQASFTTTVEGSWDFIFSMHSALDNSIIYSVNRSLTFYLKDLHPPIISNISYDESRLLDNQPVMVSIVVIENQTYRELQVSLRYRKGTVEGGFNTAWKTVVLLERGQNSVTIVSLTWEVPFVLQEGEMLQFQVIATDGFNNTAQTRLQTITYPLTREETSNLSFFVILLAIASLTIKKRKKNNIKERSRKSSC